MFRKILFLSVLVGLCTSLSAELLKPVDSDQREILTISGKRWTYYTLYREAITFEVTGPQRLKMYSRVSAPTRTSGYIDYGFSIQVDDQEPYDVSHKQKLSKGVKSQQHPNHFYSYSAKDFFSVPKGKHNVRLIPREGAAPVVVRVLEDLTSTTGEKQRLVPMVDATAAKIQVNGTKLTYYELTPEEDLQVFVDGEGTLEMISRVAFENWMGREQDYRIQIWDGGSLLGTYYFSTERSEVSEIEKHADLVPGKWRSCRVSLGTGEHKLKVRLLDKDRQVFVRLALITK